MQSLSRFISGGSTKGKCQTDTADQNKLAKSPTAPTFNGPVLTASESRKAYEQANVEDPKPSLAHAPVKPKERRGSWHEAGEFLM